MKQYNMYNIWVFYKLSLLLVAVDLSSLSSIIMYLENMNVSTRKSCVSVRASFRDTYQKLCESIQEDTTNRTKHL